MPYDMLINQGAGAVSKWVRTEPPGRKTWPFRVVVTNGAVPFAGDNVYIDEMVGGLPANPQQLYGPATDTGKITLGIATIAPAGAANQGAGDAMIEAPTEFIRARLGAFSAGTCDVRLIEAE
jgi:hypothetical protein